MPQLFLNNFQTQFIASVKAMPDSASPALELDYGVLRVSDGAAGLLALRRAARVPSFWALAAAFAICGATTNGLIGIHFIPSAHDHGMSPTVAAGLLAVVGIFDIVGTIASGWLTDRINPRILLAAYYGLRGVSLAFLPSLLSAEVRPSIVVFIVIFVMSCTKVFGGF